MERSVYLDHAATTPLDPRVLEVMLPFLGENYGNPSSFHMMGKRAKDAVEAARESIAQTVGARADEIVFTASGTESDNLAILGACRAFSSSLPSEAPRGHIITSTIEHQAVIEAVTHLQKKEGFEVTFVPVDRDGLVDPQEVARALRPDTIIVSIMAANNEIGTLQPIHEIGKLVQAYRTERGSRYPLMHSDACQAAGTMELNVEKMHLDLLTFNGSKIYGPKGVGALYLKRGVKLTPLQFGGAQEKGLRPGTENVAAIVGFAKALELSLIERAKENARLTALRDQLIQGILSNIKKTRLNGHPTNRLPNNVNISFLDLEGEALLLYLDAKGVYASTGSACTSASLDPSHVILALGMPYEVAHGSIRFTLGKSTSEDDIKYVLQVLPPLVELLRSISPVRVDEKYYV